MAFPTTSILDSGGGSNSTSPPGWTKDRAGGSNAGIQILSAKFKPNDTSWDNSYRTTETSTADCEAFAVISELELTNGQNEVSVFARLNDVGTANYDCYQAIYVTGTDIGSAAKIRLGKFVNGSYTQIGSDYNITTATVGDGIGLQCVGTRIAAWHRRSGVWTEVLVVTDSAIASGTKLGIQLKGNGANDFGGGTYAGIVLDSALPDADVTTTGWTSTPLFSKVNDTSDATVIQATAS